MNVWKRLQTQAPEATSVEQEMKRNRFFGWRDVIVCLLIVGFFLLTKNGLGLGLGGYGGLAPVLEETRFGVTGMDGTTHFFTYSEVESIELRSDLSNFLQNEKGTLVEGKDQKRVCSGLFHNDAFGDYQLHVQTQLHNFIIVHAPDGVLVFALESDETTQSLYEHFIESGAQPA